MLILARRIGESIMVGDQVEISVVDIKGDQVKLGIKAPPQVKVYRREVYAAIQQENLAAAAAAPQTLPKLEELVGSEKKPEASQPKPPASPQVEGPGAPSTNPDQPGIPHQPSEPRQPSEPDLPTGPHQPRKPDQPRKR